MILRNTMAFCLAALLVAGCAGDEARPSEKEKGYPDARYLSATGTGRSEDEARSKAVSELSRIFESRVRSDTLDRVKLVARTSGREAEESTVQKFDSRIRVLSDVEFKGVEVPRAWEENGTWRALAVLDRAKARENWLREMDVLDSEVEGRLGALDGMRSGLPRYMALKDVTDLWLTRQVLESRITVLGFGTREPARYDIREVFQELASLKAGMRVFLEIEGRESGFVREKVAEALGEAGFVVTEDRGEASVIIEGNVRVEPVDIEHPDWEYARATVALLIADAVEGVSVGEVSENRRASHLTYSEAAQKALRSVLSVVSERLIGLMEHEDGVTD